MPTCSKILCISRQRCHCHPGSALPTHCGHPLLVLWLLRQHLARCTMTCPGPAHKASLAQHARDLQLAFQRSFACCLRVHCVAGQAHLAIMLTYAYHPSVCHDDLLHIVNQTQQNVTRARLSSFAAYPMTCSNLQVTTAWSVSTANSGRNRLASGIWTPKQDRQYALLPPA